MPRPIISRFPNIEYVLWAILIGLVISNVFGVAEIFKPGVATYEFWLKAGIVLLGSRFLLGDVAKLGGVSLLLVAIEIAGSLAFMTWLGRLFGLKPKLTTLLAVGSAVCGVSAIIATQGAIDADEEDSSFAIAAILALGAIALFTFPLIGHSLHLSDHAYGIWAGLAVDNTAEATAAGALYSDSAAKLAVLTKTCRNALIGFVVLAYAIYWASKGQAQNVSNKAAFLWQKLSEICIGFSSDFTARHGRFLQQRPKHRSGQSFPLGFPVNLRGSRPSHQFPSDEEPRPAPLRGGFHRRNRHRPVHAGSGDRGGSLLRLLNVALAFHASALGRSSIGPNRYYSSN